MTRKQVLGLCISALAAVAVTATACGAPAAPAPTAAPKDATKAPAAATQAPAAATQAPAAQPTQAPKVAFPEKGKTITMIVPFGAGGSTDVGARLLVPGMEKALGVSIQVVNKSGAGSQTGLTEIAKSKPDGYTIGFANLPNTNLIYSDPERKAVFNKDSFVPIGVQVVDPSAVGVKASGKYKTIKDLVEAGKAEPEKVKFGSDGPMTDDHLGIYQLEKASGAKFANVGFDGAAANLSALLGDHIDASFGHVGDFLAQVKSGQVRVLAVADTERSKYYPDAPTFIEAGYKITNASSRTLVAPAGTPQEIVDILSAAMKKAMDEPEHMKKMDEAGLTVRYMDSKKAAEFWASLDPGAKALVEEARAAEKKK
ncbi:MAG: tripartite tricarboxylate transporter substrate binding protein [Sphingomonadaceae bacterium]